MSHMIKLLKLTLFLFAGSAIASAKLPFKMGKYNLITPGHEKCEETLHLQIKSSEKDMTLIASTRIFFPHLTEPQLIDAETKESCRYTSVTTIDKQSIENKISLTHCPQSENERTITHTLKKHKDEIIYSYNDVSNSFTCRYQQ